METDLETLRLERHIRILNAQFYIGLALNVVGALFIGAWGYLQIA